MSLTRTLALRAVEELFKLRSLAAVLQRDRRRAPLTRTLALRAVEELFKLRSLAAVFQRDRRRATLAGQANIVERKQIAELRDRLRGPLTPQERDLTARELTRLEGELAKSLDGVSYLRKGPKNQPIGKSIL